MIRVHKIKLDPNQAQATYFAQACGVARHAYNWALGRWIEQYEAGLKPAEAALPTTGRKPPGRTPFRLRPRK